MKYPNKDNWVVVVAFLLISVFGFIIYKNLNIKDIKFRNTDSLIFDNQDYLLISGNKVFLEIADTTLKRRTGLSGRNILESDQGMLFIFPEKDTNPTFWMKDMLIPIDIVWINDNKVIKIDKNISPPKENTPDNQLVQYRSNLPIDFVLEVNAGFCDENNIEAGNDIEFHID